MNPNHHLMFTQQPTSSPFLNQQFQLNPMIITSSPAKPKLISQSVVSKPIFSPPSQIYLPNSNLIPISFNCPSHPHEKARRVCSSIRCSKRVFLCEECMLEDPEHVKSHKNFIVLINDFLTKIEERNKKRGASEVLNTNIKKTVRSLDDPVSENAKDVVLHNDQYLQSLRNQINMEKLKIQEDFSRIIQLVTEQIERSKQRVLQDLDDYYVSIQEYSEELKKKVFSTSNLGFYMPETFELQSLTRFSLLTKINELRDEKLIDSFLRKIRDYVFSNSDFENIVPKEDNISIEMQGIMADKLRKIYNNPPLYKESSHGHKIFNGIVSKIPIFAEDLYTQLKDAITFIFIDESQKLFFDSVTKDNKSAQLSQINRFNLAQHSYIKTTHSKQINCIGILPPNRLATGSSDAQIMIWDLHSGDHISTYQGHKGAVISLCSMTLIDKQNIASLQKELYLASGSADKNIILWNVNDENDTIALKGHDDAITCLMDALDGRNLISGSVDRKIIVWDVLKAKILTILPCNGSIYYLHFMKDASKFLSCDYSQAINIWKIEYMRSEGSNVISKILLEKVILTKSRVISMNSGYANPNLIVGGCEDKMIRIWNLETGNDDEKFIEKNMWSINGELEDLLLVEAPNSQKKYEKFSLIYVCKGEDAINVIHDNGEKKKVHLNNFLFSTTFAFHKLQIFKDNEEEFKVVAVNQNENDRSVAILRIEEGKFIKI